jgi:hypothetical protein
VNRLVEAVGAPQAPNGAVATHATSEKDPESLLSAAWQQRMKAWVLSNSLPQRYAVVPGSFEIGYVIRGNNAVLVAREEMEADCGGGFIKRFVVEAPLVD